MSNTYTMFVKSPEISLSSFVEHFKIHRDNINAILISVNDLIQLIGCTPNSFEVYLNHFVKRYVQHTYSIYNGPFHSWTFMHSFLDYLSTLKLEINYVLNWCYAYDISIVIYDAVSMHYLIDDITLFAGKLVSLTDTNLLQYAMLDNYNSFNIVLLDNKNITISDVKTFQSVLFYKHIYNYLRSVQNIKLTHIDI